jgi:hypothetical protein
MGHGSIVCNNSSFVITPLGDSFPENLRNSPYFANKDMDTTCRFTDRFKGIGFPELECLQDTAQFLGWLSI